MRLDMRRRGAALIASCAAAIMAISCTDLGPSAPLPEAHSRVWEPGASATYLVDHGHLTLLTSSYSKRAGDPQLGETGKLDRMLEEQRVHSLQLRVQEHLTAAVQGAAAAEGKSERRATGLRLLPSSKINGHMIQVGIAMESKEKRTPDAQVVWIDGHLAAAFELSFGEVRGKAYVTHVRTTIFGKHGERVLVREDERGGSDVAQSMSVVSPLVAALALQTSRHVDELRHLFVPDALYAATVDDDPDAEAIGPCGSLFEAVATAGKDLALALAASELARSAVENARIDVRAAEAAIMEAGLLAGPALRLALISVVGTLETTTLALSLATVAAIAASAYLGYVTGKWLLCKNPPPIASSGSGSGGGPNGVPSGTISSTTNCTAYKIYENGVLVGISDPNLCFDIAPQVT